MKRENNPSVLKSNDLFPGAFQYHKANQILKSKCVLAYPTEAVWGLGCDPWSKTAVQKIYELKSRPWHKGLILVAAHLNQLRPFIADLPEHHLHKIGETPSVPTTWIVPKSSQAPSWLTGGKSSIAVRVSNHYLVKNLCHSFGGAIVSTSANPAGKDAARSAWEVKKYFGMQVGLLPGYTGGSEKPSQIKDLFSGQVLRS